MALKTKEDVGKGVPATLGESKVSPTLVEIKVSATLSVYNERLHTLAEQERKENPRYAKLSDEDIVGIFEKCRIADEMIVSGVKNAQEMCNLWKLPSDEAIEVADALAKSGGWVFLLLNVAIANAEETDFVPRNYVRRGEGQEFVEHVLKLAYKEGESKLVGRENREKYSGIYSGPEEDRIVVPRDTTPFVILEALQSISSMHSELRSKFTRLEAVNTPSSPPGVSSLEKWR